MKLIIGLGNPGEQYAKTRHNVGFLCLDTISEKLNLDFKLEEKFQALVATKNINGEKCFFVKPQTYMNASGQSVGAIAKYYKINLEDILVIYDDMDLPFSVLRLREKGSAGGHNGIKDIILHLSSMDFKRIRVGISSHDNIDAKDYVLGKLSTEALNQIKAISCYVCEAVVDFIDGVPFSIIMGKYNGKKV